MKNIFVIVTLFLMISCNTGPRPLIAGNDHCHFCKMPVADIRFGAELITLKGKIYTFDDIICLVKFFNSGIVSEENIKLMIVVNYSNNQKLTAVQDCIFLKSDHLHTPMNSGTAAFENRTDAESKLPDFPGELLTWQELQQKLN